MNSILLYQSNAYQSKLFDNKKLKFKEEALQRNQLADINQERQKQVDNLKKAYNVVPVKQIIEIEYINRQEYHITLPHQNQSIKIRMQLDEEFPQKRPKFFLEKRQKAGYIINEKTLEINYYEYFPWNPQFPNLYDLVKNIDQQIIPQIFIGENKDPIQQMGESQIEFLNDTKKCSELNNLTLDKIFPKIPEQHKESQYCRLQSQPDVISQNIQSTQEYLKVLENCQKNAENVATLAQMIKDAYKPLSDLKQQLILKQEELNLKKEQYMYYQGEIEKIQEKFEITGAIAIMDCRINILDDELLKLQQVKSPYDFQKISNEFQKLTQEKRHLEKLKQLLEYSN